MVHFTFTLPNIVRVNSSTRIRMWDI